jgi:hypothetical protein
MMLMEYARQARFSEQLRLAEREAFGNPDRLTGAMLVARHSMACEEALMTWFTFERPCDERGGTLIESFLQSTSQTLTTGQRAYLERVRTSCLRPYELLTSKNSDGIEMLRDLWTDDIIPLGGSVRVRSVHGPGMAFARAMIGTDGMPELLQALTVPRMDMERALFFLRMMREEFRAKTAELGDDDFFASATPWMLREWLTSFAAPRKTRTSKRIAQIKVELDGVHPRIWRRLLVSEDITLKTLSGILERVMGWESSHLHEFEIEGVAYGIPDPDFALPVHDESAWRISDFGFTKGARFAYRYDFGDDWFHRVIVEKFLEPEPGFAYPACIDGARACPPEDVGGTSGYRDFLKILRNTSHREHQAMKRWGRRKSRDFDPERFDTAEVNRRLRRRVIKPG